jgi:FlaG/FlaF family flagellin (archaellin)
MPQHHPNQEYPMKKATRKYLAAGLVIAGAAGLSLAAASTLAVTTSKEVAIGSGTFAPCDADGVNVGYTYQKSGTAYIIKDVTVSGIDAACKDEKIALTLASAAGTELATTTSTVSGTSFTYDATSKAIPLSTDIGDATVIISG